ncbi:MAG: HEAT repeat domain-containing protein [Dehalococcoidales bacterium]|nr:HEAT repeat domain-containing protein [Dehalococcoidales bacterium]
MTADAERLSITGQIITGLADEEKPLANKQLVELTDIKAEDLVFFDRVWKQLSPKRQLNLINRLIELAEDSAELNFDAIFRHRLYDPEEEIRCKAIEGLWENEDSTLIEPLIRIMQNDPSPKVRSDAAMALGRFAMLAEHKKINPDYMPLLCKTLLETYNYSDDIDIKRRALESVSPLSLPRVEQAILEAYKSDDIKLKASAIFAMGRNCNPNWINCLISELSSPLAELRYEAAGACGELGEEAAVPYLIEVADDDDTDVRIAAIVAIGKIGGDEAQGYLEMCLKDESEAIREAAQQALDDIDVMKDPGSIPWFDLRRAE